MKTNRILTLIAILLSFTFIQCTSDLNEGPQGVAGMDGVDGIDSTESCIACHSDTHRDPIYASYELSFHSKGLTDGAVAYAGARSSCAQCHSQEGFTDYMDNGFTNPSGYYGTSEPELVLVVNDNGTPDDESDDFEEPKLDEYGQPEYTSNPVPVVNPVGCTTCHDTHKSFDFENDGNDYALRGLDPVMLITDNTVIDYGGTSNMCITCHQPRRTGPVDNGAGMFSVTSTHWGPHHGPQATLLEGIQGMEIAGSMDYPTEPAAHRTGSTCVSCHMGESNNGTDGLHTFIPSFDNCTTTCHNGGNSIPTEVSGLSVDMATLAALLETAGIVHDDHPVKGTYTIEQAKAAWNYLFILEDASYGVHNPEYTKALIKNSIEALQ